MSHTSSSPLNVQQKLLAAPPTAASLAELERLYVGSDEVTRTRLLGEVNVGAHEAFLPCWVKLSRALEGTMRLTLLENIADAELIAAAPLFQRLSLDAGEDHDTRTLAIKALGRCGTRLDLDLLEALAREPAFATAAREAREAIHARYPERDYYLATPSSLSLAGERDVHEALSLMGASAETIATHDAVAAALTAPLVQAADAHAAAVDTQAPRAEQMLGAPPRDRDMWRFYIAHGLLGTTITGLLLPLSIPATLYIRYGSPMHQDTLSVVIIFLASCMLARTWSERAQCERYALRHGLLAHATHVTTPETIHPVSVPAVEHIHLQYTTAAGQTRALHELSATGRYRPSEARRAYQSSVPYDPSRHRHLKAQAGDLDPVLYVPGDDGSPRFELRLDTIFWLRITPRGEPRLSFEAIGCLVAYALLMLFAASQVFGAEQHVS